MIKVIVKDSLTGAVITVMECKGSARVAKKDLELEYPPEQGYSVIIEGNEDGQD